MFYIILLLCMCDSKGLDEEAEGDRGNLSMTNNNKTKTLTNQSI